jgi:hypothetical protein
LIPLRRLCRIAESDNTDRKGGSGSVPKNGGNGGTGVYMREGTASRVMAADRPYGVFYDIYGVSPE